MAIKKFVIEFEDEHACAVSRLDLWRALREHFVEDLYISVDEICPTQDAADYRRARGVLQGKGIDAVEDVRKLRGG